MDQEDPQAPLLVVWCTPGGGGPRVPALLEHSYYMLEGQLAVGMNKKEVEQTTCVYRGNHSTPPTLLGHTLDEHTCMGLSTRQQVHMTMDRSAQFLTTMSHVLCVTLQHEELL